MLIIRPMLVSTEQMIADVRAARIRRIQELEAEDPALAARCRAQEMLPFDDLRHLLFCEEQHLLLLEQKCAIVQAVGQLDDQGVPLAPSVQLRLQARAEWLDDRIGYFQEVEEAYDAGGRLNPHHVD